MKSIKELVLAQLSIDPTISLKDCSLVVPGLKKSNFYKIKRERNQPGEPSEQKINKGVEKGHNYYSSKNTSDTPSNTQSFIDDPDELLMSVSIRELNKESPDPRWASILINARKAKITVKGEDKELQRLSINSLVEILKENLPQELKEKNQSVLDNMQKA